MSGMYTVLLILRMTMLALKKIYFFLQANLYRLMLSIVEEHVMGLVWVVCPGKFLVSQTDVLSVCPPCEGNI
jgi:hypothetical protein